MIGSAEHAACVGGDVRIVQKLYRAGADFASKAETCLDAYDDLLLYKTEALLDLPKDCKIRHSKLRFQYASAGVSAVERGFCEIVKFCLDLPKALSVREEFLSGAPQEEEEEEEDRHSQVLYVVRKATLIMIAASRHDPELLDLLLSRGADATALDSYQSGAVDYLCRTSDYDTAKDADTGRCLSTLVRHGAEVNTADRDGSTALMLASLYGASLDTLTSLLDYGASVNAVNKFGNTALTLTVIRGRRCEESSVRSLTGVVELLCERGADVALMNTAGENALTIAHKTPSWSGNLQELERVLSSYEPMFTKSDNVKK